MCGFLGCFGSIPPTSQLNRALLSLKPRGPDDDGIYKDFNSWIGFRRLSILDLSPTGHQPMIFGAGRYILAFNGEIYNFQALRAKFLSRVEHNSSGDTEVLGQMLERAPVEEVISELRGMFAFVWYDTQKQVVVAARDHYGIKPLYFYSNSESLYLSSEVRALLELGLSKELDPNAILDCLSVGSVQTPHSIQREVRSLRPGHIIKWSQENGHVQNAWYRPTWKSKSQWMKGGMPEWKKSVREAVFNSIRAHLESDVDVGVFLSGGLDSSLVACAMRHIGHTKLKTFSIGYEQDAGVPDESTTAARTAKYLDAGFECEIITSQKLFDEFDCYIQAMDQPTGDALNTYLASRLAGKSVKVTMSGVGVDEWFGGYTYHRALQSAREMGLTHYTFRTLMPTIARVFEEKHLGRYHPNFHKVGQLARMLRPKSLTDKHTSVRSFFKSNELAESKILNGNTKWNCPYSSKDLLRDAPDSLRNQLFALETRTFLQNTLLRDADWASMAHSLELRTPFVDREIFDLAARLPPHAKLTPSIGKYVIRECFKDILPPWILDDRKKKTFTLPKMKWMREKAWKERIQDVLRSSPFRDRGLLSPRMTEQVLDDFYSRSFTGSSGFLSSQKIWILFIIEEWTRIHIDNF